MIYSKEVEEMCTVAQGVHHGCAPIPEEAKWVQAKEVKDISGLTHGVGWCIRLCLRLSFGKRNIRDSARLQAPDGPRGALGMERKR